MRSNAIRWLLACGAVLCSSAPARADSALDVSPTCTRVVQETTDNSLLSRGAFCQQSEPLEYVIKDETNTEVGRVEIDAYAYSDNRLNRLEWQLKFRFRTRLVSGTGAGLQMKPVIECGDKCTVAPNAGLPLAIGGLSNEMAVMITPNMNGEHLLEFRPYVEYKVAKTGDSFQDGASVDRFNGRVHIPKIRCDIGLPKKNTRGCVYPDAPAVMRSVKTNDPDVDESAIHIRDAQAAGMPGKFVLKGDGSIRAGDGARALNRLRDEGGRKKNRATSTNQCVVQYGKVNGECAFTGDPDDKPSKCDCDEYPFAASQQGAYDKAFGRDFSVRRIDTSDNRTSGGRLGCFLTGQRVLDGEEFFVDVEPGNEPERVLDQCDETALDGNE